MKTLKLLIPLLLTCTFAIAAPAPEKIRNNELQLGVDGSVADKIITIDVGDGASNPKIIITDADKDFSFSKAIKTIVDAIGLGDGDATGDQCLTFNTGDAGSNKQLCILDTSKDAKINSNLILGDGTDTTQSLLFDQLTSDISLSIDASQNASVNSSNFTIGDGTNADQTLIFDRGGTNAFLRWDESSSSIVIANDGSTEEAILTGGVGNESSLLENVGSSTSAAANALTINLKQADGSTDAAVSSSARIAFRDSVATDGAYNIFEVTAALSIVIPSGATIGHLDGTDGFIYVYALDNSGTVELAVSSVIKDESSVISTTLLDGSSDGTDIYSAVARSNVPIRLIARLTSNQVTAGTWALDVTENSPGSATFTHLDRKVEVPGAINAFIIVSAFIDSTSGTPTLITEHGDWIDSLTDSSVGNHTVNIISGVFSTKVHCVCRSSGGASTNCQSDLTVDGGPSTIAINTTTSSSGAATDARVEIICFGPK